MLELKLLKPKKIPSKNIPLKISLHLISPKLEKKKKKNLLAAAAQLADQVIMEHLPSITTMDIRVVRFAIKSTPIPLEELTTFVLFLPFRFPPCQFPPFRWEHKKQLLRRTLMWFIQRLLQCFQQRRPSLTAAQLHHHPAKPPPEFRIKSSQSQPNGHQDSGFCETILQLSFYY